MRGLGLGKLPNIWGSLLIFLQRPRSTLSASGASCNYFVLFYPSCLPRSGGSEVTEIGTCWCAASDIVSDHNDNSVKKIENFA